MYNMPRKEVMKRAPKITHKKTYGVKGGIKEDPRILVRAETVRDYLEGIEREYSLERLRNEIGDKRIEGMYKIIWEEEKQERLDVLVYGRKESTTKERTKQRVMELLEDAIDFKALIELESKNARKRAMEFFKE